MIAPDRVYAQYKDKPKAVAWYAIVPTIGQEIADAADQVRVTYDIDSQEGVQLDIIGAILVVDRNISSQEAVQTVECGDEDAESGDLDADRDWETIS